MEAKKEPEKKITGIRFVTEFKTAEEAEAAKKMLEIFDADLSIDALPKLMQGVLPGYLVEYFKRHRIRLGIKWEIKVIEGRAGYVFLPDAVFSRGLASRGNFGWMKIAVDVAKKMEELLGYKVFYFFE